MRKTMTCVAVAVVVACSALAYAQKPDPDGQKIADQYQAAFNKGDVKSIMALYADDSLRVNPDGGIAKGKAAIEKWYVDSFAGPLKGSQLTLTPGTTMTVSADTKVIEGRYAVAGATPLAGRYVNTLVRKGGQWLMASVVPVPDQPAPPKK
jgi:uncharacterized protein (TIGR02246 family)